MRALRIGLCLPLDILPPAMSGFASRWCLDGRHTINWEKTMKISKQQKCGWNLLAIAFAALAMGLAAATNAGDQVGPDITVRYADLPSRPSRVRRSCCGESSGLRSVCAHRRSRHPGLARQRESLPPGVTAAAVSKVNHPMLQAAYDLANGVRPPVASLSR